MSFEFWFMLPAAIVIATIAMASGVEGARQSFRGNPCLYLMIANVVMK